MNYLNFLIRISICFILGIAIGLERQYRGKLAGIRTITLVALGAFLFVSVSKLTTANDITRIAAQVVSGIGFLGAGVILCDGLNIRGLNTAATLWCSAAIGTLTALGFIFEACIGVVFILLTNILLRFVSSFIMRHINNKSQFYILVIDFEQDYEKDIKKKAMQLFKNNNLTIKNYNQQTVKNFFHTEITLEDNNNYIGTFDRIINKLCLENGILSIQYNKKSNLISDDDDYEEK